MSIEEMIEYLEAGRYTDTMEDFIEKYQYDDGILKLSMRLDEGVPNDPMRAINYSIIRLPTGIYNLPFVYAHLTQQNLRSWDYQYQQYL